MKKWQRFLVLLLLFFISFSTVSTQFSSKPVFADTDSTKRIQQLIEFAQTKKFDKIDGAEDLTAKDIQILGVFMSNFYTPWETRVDLLEENSQVKNDTVNALVSYAGFDEDLATKVVEMCWQISNKGEPLKIAKYDAKTKRVGDPVSRNTHEACNFDEMLYYMSGGTRGDSIDYCMYWGENRVVMESYNTNSEGGQYMSASALSFFWATAGIDWKYGKGTSLTAKTTFDDAKSISLGNDKKEFLTDWSMYIDAFGNISCDTEVGRYIVLPACMNAYTWTKNGQDAGQALNLVSLVGLASTDYWVENEMHQPSVNSHLRFYAKQSAEDGSIQYDFGYNSGLTDSDTKWTAYRGVAESDYEKATNFSSWTFNPIKLAFDDDSKFNDKAMAEICKQRGLKTNNDEDGEWRKDTWYIPNWATLAQALSKEGSINTIPLITDLVMVNDAGAFKNESNPAINISPNGVFSTETYWGDTNDDNEKQAGETYYKPLPSVHETIGTGDQIYTMSNGNLKASGANSFVYGIYLSYVLAYYGDSRVGFTFDKSNIPEIKETDLVFESLKPQADDGQMLRDLQGYAFYLLNPKEGIRYVKQLFKTKVTAILVGIHEGIVGAGGRSTVGIKKYVGFSGYVTTPQLKDLSWTAQIVEKYISFFVYMIIIVILALLCYVIVGEMTIQKMGAGVVIFAVCAFFPPYIIDGVISSSNLVADSIYGEKFMYWALVETQTYASQIEASATSGNYSDYLITLFKNNNSNWNDDSINAIDVTVKWLCPKKNNYMYSVQKETSENQGNQQSMLLSKAVNPVSRGETFSQTANASYLYRSYTDIMNYSRYLYKHMKDKGINGVDATTESESGVNASSIASNTDDAYSKGFTVLNGSTDNTNFHWKAVLTSSTLGGTLSEDVSKATQSAFFGIKQSDIDYDLSSINTASGKLDKSGLYAYAQLSESPYYYFSWNFYDQGMSPDEGATNGFKSLVLGSRTGGGDSYFFNTKMQDIGGGELRDYLDMRNLFTSVIPVLRASNNLTVQWDKMYGLNTYEGISCNPDEVMDSSLTSEEAKKEWEYKHWHNVNVARLWNSYTPWVDVMYDSSYSAHEKVRVGGKMKVVEDPLNPAKYYPSEGRPMIFSRSEMKYYGLNESDLTTVESKIIQVQDKTREDLLKLMNYYNFNDSVLNASASMIATFNFNEVFSDKHFFSSSKVLYPQAFELKNFSYDAYLRFIIANASGESLSGTENLYQTVVENSSIVTGLLMILNDAIACYVISGEKLIFLLAIFFLSIMMIISATISLEGKVGEVIINGLCKPLVSFLIISICHSKVISWFMGSGAVNVTGELNTSVSLGDPAITLILLLVVHIIITILYYRICKGLIKNTIKYGRAIFNSVAGVAGGMMSAIAKGMGYAKPVAVGGLLAGGLAGAGVGSLARAGGKLASSKLRHFIGRGKEGADSRDKASKKGKLTAEGINSKIRDNYSDAMKGKQNTEILSNIGIKGVGRSTSTVVSQDKKTGESMKYKGASTAVGGIFNRNTTTETKYTKDSDGNYNKPKKDKVQSSSNFNIGIFGRGRYYDKRTGESGGSSKVNLLLFKREANWDNKSGVKKSSIRVLNKTFRKETAIPKKFVGGKKGLGAKTRKVKNKK